MEEVTTPVNNAATTVTTARHHPATTEVIMHKTHPLVNVFPHPEWLSTLTHVHPSLRNIFPITRVESPLAGRIQKFLENWKVLTSDKHILDVVKGWVVPLLSTPIQSKIPHPVSMNYEEERAMDLEVASMLTKGAIREAIPKADQFLSNVFVTPKGEGLYRPIINLKKLNQSVPYLHFKMEGLKDVKNLLRKGDWMCKLDLKDAYFSVPVNPRSRKLIRFLWKGTLYEFLCLAFGLGPAPRIFTKLMKVPVTLLRKLGIRIVIYLDDMLLMASSLEGIKLARDTTLFLFHHLGLVINMKKSVLDPDRIMDFLGIIVNSLSLSFSLPEAKVQKLTLLCQEAHTAPVITLRSLCSLLGKLRATAPAVTPAPLQLRYLQQSCIRAQAQKLHYESLISLTPEGKTELQWWIENLALQRGRPLHLPPPDLIICSDAAKTGAGEQSPIWGRQGALGARRKNG